MGVSKAMMEKVFVAKSRTRESTHNMRNSIWKCNGSRGSVIPHFYQQIKDEKAITVTDPNMTRFMMTLDDAVDLSIVCVSKRKSRRYLCPKITSNYHR